jgi:hypothetical protein
VARAKLVTSERAPISAALELHCSRSQRTGARAYIYKDEPGRRALSPYRHVMPEMIVS